MNPAQTDGKQTMCADCYWFIAVFGGVKRCCNGISPLCGNDEPTKTCDHWTHERPQTREFKPPQQTDGT